MAIRAAAAAVRCPVPKSRFDGCLNGRTGPATRKFGRLCETAKTNNNKQIKAKKKVPAAKSKKTTIKKAAPKKKKTTKARAGKENARHY
jgi:hypothetical protein